MEVSKITDQTSTTLLSPGSFVLESMLLGKRENALCNKESWKTCAGSNIFRKLVIVSFLRRSGCRVTPAATAVLSSMSTFSF